MLETTKLFWERKSKRNMTKIITLFYVKKKYKNVVGSSVFKKYQMKIHMSFYANQF